MHEHRTVLLLTALCLMMPSQVNSEETDDGQAASFVSTRPVPSTGGAVARRMSAIERDSQLFSGLLGLTLTSLFIVGVVAAVGQLLFCLYRRPVDERISPRGSADRDADVARTTCPWCDAEIRSDVDRCTECDRPI